MESDRLDDIKLAREKLVSLSHSLLTLELQGDITTNTQNYLNDMILFTFDRVIDPLLEETQNVN